MNQKMMQKAPEQAPKSTVNLTGIPIQMKLDFERRSGLSFDDVRVHYNSDKPSKIGALAYTRGTQVYVGPGQERYLRHELGHVVQQKYGLVRPTATFGGLPVNLDPRLEHHADTFAMRGTQASSGNSVVQMALPKMRCQQGADCGIHALARAILKLTDPEIENESKEKLDARSALEKELASLAVEKRFSTMGEAFNPNILINTFQAYQSKKSDQSDQSDQLNQICNIQAERKQFNTLKDLFKIVKDAKEKNGVILFPYFPKVEFDPNINIMTPIEAGENQNAHWGVLDVEKAKLNEEEDHEGESTIPLYEGNKCGIVGARGPLEVTLEALNDSNQSLEHEFDWGKFIEEEEEKKEEEKKEEESALITWYNQFRSEGQVSDLEGLKKKVKESIKDRKKPEADTDMIEDVSLQGELIVLTKISEDQSLGSDG